MKRYYLSTIVGTGAYDDPYQTAAERAFAAAGLTGNIRAALAPDRNPVPGETVLVVCDTTNHVPILADPKTDGLPDFPLDAKLSAIQTLVRAAAKAAIQRRGISVVGFDTLDGYRDLVNYLGQHSQPATFDANNFDA